LFINFGDRVVVVYDGDKWLTHDELYLAIYEKPNPNIL